MAHASSLTTDGLVQILFGSSAFQMLRAGSDLGLFTLLHRRPCPDPAGDRPGTRPGGSGRCRSCCSAPPPSSGQCVRVTATRTPTY